MKNAAFTFILLAAGAASSSATTASAQESARVVSSTPVTQQVGVPRQACATVTTGAPPQCSTQTIYENRTVGYKVVYEYAGKQYSVQLPQDPGPTLQLRVSVAPNPAPTSGPQPQAMPVTAVNDPAQYADPNAVMMVPGATTVVQAPAYVYYDNYPGYVGYYNSPYYGVWGPAIALGLYGGGWYGRGGGWYGRGGGWHGGGHHGRR